MTTGRMPRLGYLLRCDVNTGTEKWEEAKYCQGIIRSQKTLWLWNFSWSFNKPSEVELKLTKIQKNNNVTQTRIPPSYGVITKDGLKT